MNWSKAKRPAASKWVQPNVMQGDDFDYLYQYETGYFIHRNEIESIACVSDTNFLIRKVELRIPLNVTGIRCRKEKSFGNDN